MDELSIKVNIADRFYPLSVSAEQEEQVRKAAKLINDRLKAFEQQFSVKDKQDILSMCALELATELIRLEQTNLTDNKDLTANLMEIKQLLKNVSV